MSESLIYFNGINGATGSYGLPPMTPTQLSRAVLAAEEARDADRAALAGALASRHRRARGRGHLGVKEGVDVKDPAQAGWGVIFSHDADPAIEDALSELLSLRRGQAGERFRIYKGGTRVGGGVRPGESKTAWLARNGMEPGPADPDRVPYYLLIAGSPQAIPYSFQYELSVQYAVGRLHFDTPDEWAAYARGVVRAERGECGRGKRAAFFGAAHDGDAATQQTVSKLITPLAQRLAAMPPAAGWQIDTIVRTDARKTRLSELLSGPQAPALLLTGSHGLEFPLGDSRQLPHQGALLCSDWPGPAAWDAGRPIGQEFYLAGDDIPDNADVTGLLAFFFACYGAGTPKLDDYYHRAFAAQEAIAAEPFIAALPQRLLGHPRGGALALLGHVERAWSYSYNWPGVGAGLTAFESTLRRLLAGYPIGAATEFFHERWAELTTVLTSLLADAEAGAADPFALAEMWTATNDSRGYVVLGDPAVRLA